MAKKRGSNKKVVIILLIILLLALAIGYAAFSNILTISGTANAKGTFDMEFRNPQKVKEVGVDTEKTTIVISPDDENKLLVNVADLAYPGAGVEFSVDIYNNGTIPATVNDVKLKEITETEYIQVKGLEQITSEHQTIEAGDTCNIHFTVEWPADKIPETALNENESGTFELQIEYTQATGAEFDGKPSHTEIKKGNTTSTNTSSENTI